MTNCWSLIYDGFEPAQEGHREALCALGNGYFVTRGAAAENAADETHYPGTYLAGGYNRLRTGIAGHVPFDRETIPKNVNYYLRRTSHGSTLSAVVHSWVLARSDRPRSWQLFTKALESDISDVQGGTTAEGIHLGAMAGTVDLVQRGHTGIVTRGDVLWFNPCLPDGWARLRMRLRYREQSLEVEVETRKLIVRSIAGPERPIRVGCKDRVRKLAAGETVEFDLTGSGCDEA